MPEVHLKELYKAKNLDALNKQVNIKASGHPRLLIKSANTVLHKAELSDTEKDEELAYIYFMRYFDVVRAIQQHQDYAKNKKYYEGMLDGKRMKKVIRRAEELSSSLDRRYKLLANAKEEEDKEERELQQKEREKLDQEKQKVFNDASISKSLEVSDGFTSCEKLYSLTKERVSSFLVVDVRPREDFLNSYMKITWLINVPEELLKPGLTADKVGREIEETHRVYWKRRHSYDYIIICDWGSEESPFTAPIKVLLDAMLKWDPGSTYRSPPLVLKGGFELFALKYPILVTNNPCLEAFAKRNYQKKSSRKSTDIDDITGLLNFQYPDLNTGFIVTPPPSTNDSESFSKPSINRDLKPMKFEQKISENTPSTDINSTSTVTESSNTLDQCFIADASSNSSRIESKSENWIDSESDSLDPVIPKRSLKPQEVLEDIKDKRISLVHEHEVLEHSIKAEKDALDKLEEIEKMRKLPEETMDDRGREELRIRQDELEDELKKKREYVIEMEKKCSYWQKQHDEMALALSKIFTGQMKVDARGSSDQQNAQMIYKNEKDVFNASEERRQLLLEEVKIMREKRKEKEMMIKEQKKKEKDRLNFMMEEKINENKENYSPDHRSSRLPKKTGTSETYTTKLKSGSRSPVRGGSNLKRSHSALNLSQINELDSSSSITPSFDRSLKPLNSPRRQNVNAARQRNFEPKYGTVGPTKTGLKNLGNTCYMNSIVQCLNNTFLIAKYFFEGHYSEDINPRSKHRGEIAEEFGAVIRALWCGQYRSIAIWDLKTVIGRCHHPFFGYDQHDAHELLIKLMDWLHDDLNLVTCKVSKMDEQNHENIPDYLAAQNVMDALAERDRSIIRDLFYGLHRSVIVCLTCDFRSVMFEPFSVVTLSLIGSKRCSLREMLNDYYRESRIEYKCSRCQRVRDCTRKLDVWKLPPVVVIHLNRFEHDVLTKKTQSYVDFPIDSLDFSQYMASQKETPFFDLYAVSNHYGTIDGGHYTAFCKSPNKTWSKFDDHEVYDLSREALKTSAAYVLFYEASNTKGGVL